MAQQKQFVIQNGLQVSQDLIFADKDLNRVGIGLTLPQHTLHVNGGIAATTLKVSGISSTQDLIVTGNLYDNNLSTGSTNQYLKSTPTGFEWANFPTLRTLQTYTATEGQTNFSFVHTPNELDVFVNGVRLTPTEYFDSSIDVSLITPASSGDIIDLVGYGVLGAGVASTSGISGITVLDEGIPVGNIDAVTSLNFVGGTVEAAGTGAGVTITVSPLAFETLSLNSVTTKELNVTGENYSILDLNKTLDYAVGIGSTELILNNNTSVQVNDVISVVGILTQVPIVGFATVSVTPYNQIFLNTTTEINISAGSTEIGIANTSGVSIGNSISLGSYFDNVPIVGFSTIAIVSPPGFVNAVLIPTGFTTTSVIPVSSNVGISTIITQRDAVLIGTANTASVGIGTTFPVLVQRIKTENSNLNLAGIVTATGGFISVGNTSPVLITLVGNQVIFNVVGIGSTSLQLF